jgi:hypothetical protein
LFHFVLFLNCFDYFLLRRLTGFCEVGCRFKAGPLANRW